MFPQAELNAILKTYGGLPATKVVLDSITAEVVECLNDKMPPHKAQAQAVQVGDKIHISFLFNPPLPFYGNPTGGGEGLDGL